MPRSDGRGHWGAQSTYGHRRGPPANQLGERPSTKLEKGSNKKKKSSKKQNTPTIAGWVQEMQRQRSLRNNVCLAALKDKKVL